MSQTNLKKSVKKMNKDFIKAKELLLGGGYTCVLVKGEEVFTSAERGVKPLVSFRESQKDYSGYSAADKVVGKATAFLYVLLGVKAVYANIISKSALEVLERYNIETKFMELVENIINRKGDGICPFEKAVLDIEDVDEVYDVIRGKMSELNIKI